MRKLICTAIVFLVLGTSFGCKNSTTKPEPNKQLPLVQKMTSPAAMASSLPHIMVNKDVALMSWVETVDDTLTTLKYSELVDGEWQESENILSGTNWFVNWADYPMISENNGNLWSHVLKSLVLARILMILK